MQPTDTPTPPPTAPALALRTAAIDALAQLLDLYLTSQPRSLRRSILTAGRAAGWRLDRSTAADLVAAVDDATLRYVTACLFDWTTSTIALDDELADVDVDDAQLVEHAHAQLAGALSRVSW